MRKTTIRCGMASVASSCLVSTIALAHGAAGHSVFEAVVRPVESEERPVAGKIRVDVELDAPATLDSVSVELPPSLRLVPRGIRRCTLTAEQLASAGADVCRRSRVGSGTLILAAHDGTEATGRVRLFRGPGDTLSVRTVFGDRGSTGFAEIADGGQRLILPVLGAASDSDAVSRISFKLGRRQKPSVVRVFGCDGGQHAIQFTIHHAMVAAPEGGSPLSSESWVDRVPCS